MEELSTLTEGLLRLKNSKTGIVFINDDKTEEFMEYGRLIELSQNYLAYLQSTGIKKGDEAILAFHSIKNFVISYWASLFGGIIPVPLVLPKSDEEIKKAINVWKVLERPWMLADDELIYDKFEKKRSDESESEVVSDILNRIIISKDCETVERKEAAQLVEVHNDDIAFIQFSSGSTGNPKGVVLTHNNIICNALDFIESSKIKEDDTMFSWKPITHDFGIIAFHLLPVVAGISQFRMTTKHFIWNATDWFSVVNKHRITILGSPNFGVQHFLNRFDVERARRENWDLSCVRILYNGAEMIHPQLCQKFIKTLSEFKLRPDIFKPGYGLAENTLVASVCNSSEYLQSIVVNANNLSIGEKIVKAEKTDQKGVEYVLCGSPCCHSEIKIVDDEGHELEENYIGHIYIKGDCVTKGYYRNEQATNEIKKDKCWLNTQDVGFMYNGQLVIIGRTKEVIIVGGTNYYPRDIEDAILQEVGYSKLNQYIACGIQNQETGTDDLVIFVYYKGSGEKFADIEKFVKQIVMKNFGLEVSKVVPIRHIQKTTSGKVQRFKIVKEYLEKNSISQEEKAQQVIMEDSQTEVYKQKFQEILNQYVELDEKEYTTSLFKLSVSSMQLIKLQQHLEEAFQVKLESTFIIDHPTVKDLMNEIFTLKQRKETTELLVEKEDNASRATNEIAVISMAFRFPGDIENEEMLWEALSKETDVIREMPKERWEDCHYDGNAIITTSGGFLSDVESFDPFFFQVTPKEAESIDPQHRMLLELTWKAFENAGVDPLSLKDSSDVGVYVGISSNDYLQVGRELGHDPESYTYSGNMLNSAAGRISYTYGLRGPCEAIDTACSSSLYAIHHAMNDIKLHQCKMAVVCAANLILTPEVHMSFSKLNALSASGRCRTFDDSADGYVRSEGGAVLILKDLAQAKNDGDPILGVIKSSAVNHNGHSGGLTVPSGVAQQELVMKAISNAGLSIDDISFVEAHGTGTKIGDPQEINALSNVFKDKKEKLYIGSVKSNFGHMEAAAGMGSVCKVLVSMKHNALPATMGFKNGNKLIDWDKVPLSVVSRLQPWNSQDGKLRAGVSSFGISGSNAHIIMENYIKPEEKKSKGKEAASRLLVLSAKSRTALMDYAGRIADWLEEHKEQTDAICYSLNTRRAQLQYRESFVLKEPEDMKAKLAFLSEKTIGMDSSSEKGPLVFMFTGQGSQYPKMAYELYQESAIFRAKLDELDRIFKQQKGFSVIKIMFHCETEEFKRPLYAQAMIFSIEMALAWYWTELGIQPDMVLGHSIGEIAAACYAGVTSVEESVALILERAIAIEETEKTGYMVTLFCSEESARNLIKGYDNVSIAAVNASENTTISGASEELQIICEKAEKQRIYAKKLQISHPFHSVLMKEKAQVFYERIQHIHFQKSEIPVISTQTGKLLLEGQHISAEYWRDNMSRPVFFKKAVETAVSLGCSTFVEIGSMSILSSLILQDYKDSIKCIPTLRKKLSSIRCVQESVGELWKRGWSVNWTRFYEETYEFVQNIPNMSFDHQKIWYQDLREKNDVMNESTVLKEEKFNMKNSVNSQLDATRKIKDFVKASINQITGVQIEKMYDDLQLFSIGMDSLMLVQLGKRIDDKYGVDIPMKVFFNSLHTVEQLVNYIGENSQTYSAEENLQYESSREEQVIPQIDQPVYIQKEPAISERAERNGPQEYAVKSLEEKDGLEGIINQQLYIMQKQLELYGGTPIVEKHTQKVLPATLEKEVPESKPQEKSVKRKVGTYSNNIELEDDVLTKEQTEFIQAFEKKYVQSTIKSKDYTERHREVLADWIASLNFNPSMKRMVYPIVSARSKGAKFWDLDGNEYIDTAIGYGVSFFGHNPDFIHDALQEQLELGFELGPQNRLAGEVATLIHELIGVDRVTFCNTGTEAVMVALRLARAVTGRDKIAKFITSFHGSFDGILAEADGDSSRPMAIGIPQKMIEDTSVLTYGSMDSIEYIRKHGDEMAAVLVEPVQTRNPSLQPREFLHELRKVCTEKGIALIFDEMVTGFRIELGGAQAFFDVKADMVLYGKLVAGGMPIGIVAGDRKYLDAVDGGVWYSEDSTKPEVPTTFFAGTFCKHPLTMASCKAVLTFLKEHGAEEIKRVNQLTNEFVEEVNAFFLEEEVPMKVVNFGSLYKYQPLISTNMSMFSLEQNLFFKLMAYEGIYTWERRTCFFSLAHTLEDRRKIIDAIHKCIKQLRDGGFEFRVDQSVLQQQSVKKN